MRATPLHTCHSAEDTDESQMALTLVKHAHAGRFTQAGSLGLLLLSQLFRVLKIPGLISGENQVLDPG